MTAGCRRIAAFCCGEGMQPRLEIRYRMQFEEEEAESSEIRGEPEDRGMAVEAAGERRRGGRVREDEEVQI